MPLKPADPAGVPAAHLLLKRFGIAEEELRLPGVPPSHPKQTSLHERILILLAAVETDPVLLSSTLDALRAPKGGPVGDAVVKVFRTGMTNAEAIEVGVALKTQWLEHLGAGPAVQPPSVSPDEHQVGGNHYLMMAITPREYIIANDLGWDEGNIVKYVSRWQDKDGMGDLLKARHYLDLLIARVEAGEDASPA